MAEKNHVIDKCDNCGFISYSVIAACPVCGNYILTSEIIDKSSWVKGRVKERLNWKKTAK